MRKSGADKLSRWASCTPAQHQGPSCTEPTQAHSDKSRSSEVDTTHVHPSGSPVTSSSQQQREKQPRRRPSHLDRPRRFDSTFGPSHEGDRACAVVARIQRHRWLIWALDLLEVVREANEKADSQQIPEEYLHRSTSALRLRNLSDIVLDQRKSGALPRHGGINTHPGENATGLEGWMICPKPPFALSLVRPSASSRRVPHPKRQSTEWCEAQLLVPALIRGCQGSAEIALTTCMRTSIPCTNRESPEQWHSLSSLPLHLLQHFPHWVL